MAKLHQVLAVEADLEGKYKRVSEESKKTFGKAAMFTGFNRKLVLFAEAAEGAAEFPEENASLETTVAERLAYNAKAISKYLDAVMQKEATNQVASAQLMVRGVVIADDVPATMLLALESRLKYIRGIYEAIPTLPAGTEWEPSTTRGDNIWDMVHPEEKLKTELTFKSQIIVEPTEHHPAQIEKWQEQMPVGKFVKKIWSGMITTAKKSELLDKIDALIKAVKMARQQANSTKVLETKIGQSVMDFINS